MKPRFWIVLISLVAIAGIVAGGLLAADSTAAAGKAPGKDVKCPVSGKPINPDQFVEFEKAKVYMCCDKCPVAFNKDPAKFAAKAHLQMVQTEQLKQVACPFTGKPMKASTAIDVGGTKVAFCCDDCKAKAEKAKGDEQVALVFKDTSKGFKPAKDEDKPGQAEKK